MKLKKGETTGMFETFQVIAKIIEENEVVDRFLAYDVLENLELVQGEASKLAKIHPQNIINKYQKEYNDKIIELSEKDEEGNPVTIKDEDGKDTGSVSVAEENMEIFNVFIAEFNERSKPIIEKVITDFNEIIGEEIELDLKEISLEKLPDLEMKHIKNIKKLIIKGDEVK